MGPFSQFWGKKNFYQKIQVCQAQLHMSFWHHAKFWKKLTIQFQENAWTEGQMEEGWKHGRTDRPYFIGPFRLLPGVQKYKIDSNLLQDSPNPDFESCGNQSVELQ